MSEEVVVRVIAKMNMGPYRSSNPPRRRQRAVELTTMLAGAMLAAAGLSSYFYTRENQALLDDSFIYLHIATNIVESGTARFFPITDSELLLASSPLRALSLVPGIAGLQLLGVPVRTLESARVVFLSGSIAPFLLFLPFWLDRLHWYFAVSALFFFLVPSLDSLWLMEGGVLFFSVATLVAMLTARSRDHFTIGIIIVLVGLSRPEIGAIAAMTVTFIYIDSRAAVARYAAGAIAVSIGYWVVMAALGVYPIPSTIWSKQVTASLNLFGEGSLLDVLPLSCARMFGFQIGWVGWLFFLSPLIFSLPLKRGSWPVVFATVALIVIAAGMPGNNVWYSENFLIVIFALGAGASVELCRQGFLKAHYVLTGLLIAWLIALTVSSYGKDRLYPWNVGSPIYRAYARVGQSAIGNGTYRIEEYSAKPVRIRMCEIGIVSFMGGKGGWIYDLCGLGQIGNLPGASRSWLRVLYPRRIGEGGTDQLTKFRDHAEVEVIDVWALRSERERAEARRKCTFVDDNLCINHYR